MRIGHASGGDPSGTPGDQSGREVRVQDWYAGAWDIVLRAKDAAAASRMAAFCEAASANPNVGYSQTTRNSLRAAAREAGWDGSKISAPCNCDCSSFVTVCAEAAGLDMEPAYSWGNAPWTGNMRTQFGKTGAFDVLTERKYLSGPDYLRRGDILVDEDRHTVMALDDGEKAKTEEDSGPGAVPSVGSSVVYTGGDGVYFRPDPHDTDVCCEVEGEHKGRVIAVKPVSARPVLVLFDNDVCGWVALEHLTPPTAPPQRIHTVVYGDTIWGLSKTYGVDMEAIAKANGMASIRSTIHPGDRLVIPDN